MILTTPEYCAAESVRGPTTHRGCWGCGRLFRASSDAERYCPKCVQSKVKRQPVLTPPQPPKPQPLPVVDIQQATVEPVKPDIPGSGESVITCPCCGQAVQRDTPSGWFDLVLMRVGKTHRYDDCVFDFARMKFERDGHSVELTKTSWRLLAVLVAYSGEIATRDRLMDMVFHQKERSTSRTVDTFIAELRKHVGRHIETIHGIGYRFVAIPDPNRSYRRRRAA